MPRIQTHVTGTSYKTPDKTTDRNLDQEPDFDTGDRMREGRWRDSMHESREAESDARNTPRYETSDLSWRRPMNLDAPPPRPGYRQRWVRVEFRSESDNLNWQGKVREGWAPRDPATISEADKYFGFSPSMHNGTGVIRVGGLILMEIPEHKIFAKRRAIDAQTRRQENSVSMETEKISREGVRAGGPPIVREDRADVTTGRLPPTLAD